MSSYLNIDSAVLKDNNSYWTAREISQQPSIWREASTAIDQSRSSIDAWLAPLLDKPDLHIVLIGAGTSAFIGETLAPWMRKNLKRRVTAIATTDLVAAPEYYLVENTPTLLVSFARSGDSPESVASVNLANQMLGDCHHLVLTCNPQGYLAQSAIQSNNMFCLLMPENTNDRSFAMTSSYSSMLVSCALIFCPDQQQLETAARFAEQVIEKQIDSIQALAQVDFTRLVVLGAGCLFGTAREAALKCLELSAGKIVPMNDTPMGFRHGPKSVVDKNTLIIHFQSDDAYIRQYDHDLFAELNRDNKAAKVIALSPALFDGDNEHLDDLWLSLPYIVFCQMLAFFKAQVLNITADNPCPSGEVNRVVKGVAIHPYEGR